MGRSEITARERRIIMSTKVKKVAAHPPYANMITAAIKGLKDKKGSSRQAILKYVVANNKVDATKAAVRVKLALRKMVVAKKGWPLLLLARREQEASSCLPRSQKPRSPRQRSQRPRSPRSQRPKKVKKPAAKKPATKKPVKKVVKKKV